MKSLLETLENVGFSKGESKVYLALVDLQESTIGPISKKAGVTPAKTYPILDKLIEKGLVSSVNKFKTKYFQVLDSQRILHYLNQRKEKIKPAFVSFITIWKLIKI